MMNNKKYIMIYALILMTVIFFNGCAGQVNEDAIDVIDNISTDASTDDAAYQGQADHMLAYWLVLNNKMPLISANEGCQEFFWDEYYWRLSELTLTYQTSRFGIVDLDNDGVEELVMTGYMPEITQILDYQDGKVYSYQFVYRGMARIGTDGVYSGSSGSDVGGFFRIHLDKGNYEEETLAYMDGDYFEVGGVEVSSDEFYTYTASLLETEMMEDMDFTEEMLDKVLLGEPDEEVLSEMRNREPEEICDENNPKMADVPETYRAVLNGSEEFVCVTEDGENFLIDGNCIRDAAGENQGQILYFSIVDMDGDEEEEVVLAYSLTCIGNILILHETEGIIYGYVFDCWDEMNAITNDGIFQIGSRSVNQYGKVVSFDKDGCVIEEVDYNGDINEDRIRYYSWEHTIQNEIMSGDFSGMADGDRVYKI